MEIIATIHKGVLISATTSEINEILTSVNGVCPEKLKIGMKIPAIDYASTIKKIKELENHRDFIMVCREVNNFSASFNLLKEAVVQASLLSVE